jgi:SAM-dependent methyltransferase
VKLKAEWFSYLHDFRVREFRLIFDRFPEGCFSRILELGAGDAFQSHMLVPYGHTVVSTDVRLPPVGDDSGIDARELSADHVADVFEPGEFDLVYSSNMLEHVPDPPAVFRAAAAVLADDGITIHVMPNRIWKVCQVVLWIPHLLAGAIDDLVTARSPRAVLDRLRRTAGPDGAPSGTEKNTPTVVRRRRSTMRKALLPDPHGVSATHREEFAVWARRRWSAEFERAGLEIVAVLNGPFSSGYGFGLRSVTARLERHVGSEYVFVAKKAGQRSRYEQYFRPAA